MAKFSRLIFVRGSGSADGIVAWRQSGRDAQSWRIVPSFPIIIPEPDHRLVERGHKFAQRVECRH